jgi:ATP-binding cassette subfamily B protein
MKELRALLPYLRRYRRLIGWGIVLVIVANGFGLAAPYLIKEAIDSLADPGVTRADFTTYALLIVVTAVFGGAARYGMRELLNGVSRKVEYDLRHDFFARLLTLDATFYGRTQTGDVMSRATNDISAVRTVAGPAYMHLANTIVVTIIALTLMFWIDPWLTLVAVIPMLALPPLTMGFGRLIHDRFERIQDQFGTLSTMAQENLSGARIVRAYGMEHDQTGRFGDLSLEYLDRNMSLARVSGLFHPILALFSGLAMALALLVGGRSVMSGDITVGDFVAFILYLGMLSWPLIALGRVVNLLQRGAASMGRINRIMNTQPSARDIIDPSAGTGDVRGEIEFRGVSFRYPGTDRVVLRDVSFRAPAGSMLAVVGGTGSGKSTLVSLLVRLYEPASGEILLDGIPVHQYALHELRTAIGIVPQDAFLFSDTIRHNLALGFDEQDADREEVRIREAAGIAQLDDTIGEFPAGYDTMLGERGVNLSGGQKQRATLARAIARDPAVLILDDSLSAVDTHTEAEILAGLRGVMRDRTSIVVSHRVTAVMGADRIIVLEDGEIVESGSHAELLELGGSYTALQRRQLLSDDIADGAALAATAREL